MTTLPPGINVRINPAAPIHPRTRLEVPSQLAGAVNLAMEVQVGAFTHVNGGSPTAVRIGRYCSIAPGVIIGQPGHPLNRLTVSPLTWSPSFAGWDQYGDTTSTPSPALLNRPITIVGNDVWIGQSAFIKAGVTIGDGAVVGAGSVVTKDVPYAIVGGNPAKLIRMRFDDATAARLQASQWWRYNILTLGLDMSDVHSALEGVEAAIKRGEPYYEPDVFTGDASPPQPIREPSKK